MDITVPLLAPTLGLTMIVNVISASKVFSELFPLFNGFGDKFGIIDFYLKACADHNIRGYLKKDLRLLDVGKLDTLKEAEDFISGL